MKYSLVIGSYNPNREWLKEALQSAEGLFDEVILVDDGSDIPIEGATVRHEANRGFYEARNTGITLATGDIIASLDDDDLFIEEAVVNLKKFIEENDSDIWHFPVKLFGEQQGVWGHQYNLSEFLNGNQIPSGSWFKKSLWERLGGYQYPLAEDYDFWVRAWKKGKQFTYFPECVYLHRMRKDSVSAKWIGDKFLKIREDIRAIYAKS